MVAPSLHLSAMSRPLFKRSRGLIGLDLGTRFIKAAQVRPTMGGWKVAAVHSIPVSVQGGLSASTIKDGVIRKTLAGIPLKSSGFSGRRTVLGLPNELAEPRSLELPAGDEFELASMIEQEMTTYASPQTDFWTCDVIRSDEGDVFRVNAIEVAPEVLNCCADDLTKVGLDCEVIDALPFALSRAVKYVDRDLHKGPVAALDWGAGQPSLVVLNEDGPVFTRSLRDCGLGSGIDQIQSQLGIDELECAQLRTTCGVRHAGNVTSRVSEKIGRILADCMDELLDQLQRTLAFVGQRGIKPRRIWMFGCGATIAGMDQALASQLDIGVRSWQLEPEQLSRTLTSLPSHAVFGAAVGFSLLKLQD